MSSQDGSEVIYESNYRKMIEGSIADMIKKYHPDVDSMTTTQLPSLNPRGTYYNERSVQKV